MISYNYIYNIYIYIYIFIHTYIYIYIYVYIYHKLPPYLNYSYNYLIYFEITLSSPRNASSSNIYLHSSFFLNMEFKFSNVYKFGGTPLPNVIDNTDLGVVMDNQLTFKPHINGIVVCAKQRAALILRCFYTRDPQLLIKAFTVYVRPLLEYCCSVWSPHLMCLISCIEGIQRNFTKKLKGNWKLVL